MDWPLRPATLADSEASDQRSHLRYPISLEVEYKLLNRGHTKSRGSGRTLNISSGGALIAISNQLALGARVEVIVDWPFLLDGIRPLKLVMRGRVVRSVGTSIAIRTEHRKFRATSGSKQTTSPH
jgi:c-di-GMP-binding flagellar brake protein YcgR